MIRPNKKFYFLFLASILSQGIIQEKAKANNFAEQQKYGEFERAIKNQNPPVQNKSQVPAPSSPKTNQNNFTNQQQSSFAPLPKASLRKEEPLTGTRLFYANLRKAKKANSFYIFEALLKGGHLNQKGIKSREEISKLIDGIIIKENKQKNGDALSNSELDYIKNALIQQGYFRPE